MSRIVYHPGLEDWDNYFRVQTLQTGHGGMSMFVGLPYQRGGGIGNILGRLFRFILPIASKSARSVGKTALTAGASVLADMARGASIKDSAKARSRQAGAELADKAGAYLRQQGGRKRRRSTVKRPKKKNNRSKKRRTGTVKRRRPPTKKRRTIRGKTKARGRSALFKNVQIY